MFISPPQIPLQIYPSLYGRRNYLLYTYNTCQLLLITRYYTYVYLIIANVSLLHEYFIYIIVSAWGWTDCTLLQSARASVYIVKTAYKFYTRTYTKNTFTYVSDVCGIFWLVHKGAADALISGWMHMVGAGRFLLTRNIYIIIDYAPAQQA